MGYTRVKHLSSGHNSVDYHEKCPRGKGANRGATTATHARTHTHTSPPTSQQTSSDAHLIKKMVSKLSRRARGRRGVSAARGAERGGNVATGGPSPRPLLARARV